MNERKVIERWKQGDMRNIYQKPADRFLHVGIEVDRVDDFHVPARGQRLNRLADILDRLSKIFTSMRSEQDQTPGAFLPDFQSLQ